MTRNSRPRGVGLLAEGSYLSNGGDKTRHTLVLARRRHEAAKDGVDAGTAESVSRTTPESLRVHIAAGQCPWCGEGDFHNLALHTNISHGVSGKELRRMAGLPAKASICSPELSQKARQNVAEREDWQETTQRALQASRDAKAYLTAAQARSEAMAPAARARTARIIERLLAGDIADEIAADEGLNIRTVLRSAKEARPDLNLRSLGKRAGNRREKHAAVLRQASVRAAEVRRKSRLARYEELGSDWAAIETMAAEQGVRKGAVREYLRRAGAVLPDGRIATTRRRQPRPKQQCRVADCERYVVAHQMCDMHYRQWRRGKP